MSKNKSGKSSKAEESTVRDSKEEQSSSKMNKDILIDDSPDLDAKINEKLSKFGNIPGTTENQGKKKGESVVEGSKGTKASLVQDEPSEKMMIENLLEKCEVTNLSDLYTEWVNSKYGILSQTDIFNENHVFTLEKVQKDLKGMASLILVKLLDPRPIPKSRRFAEDLDEKAERRNEIQDRYKKNWYILNTKGLGRVLKVYRKRKIFGVRISLSQVLEQFEIPEEQHEAFKRMVQTAIQEKNMYANYIQSPSGDLREDLLVFFSKYKTPEKMRLLGLLLVLITVVTLSIWGYITFVRPLWLQ